jgi:hypothetical protein
MTYYYYSGELLARIFFLGWILAVAVWISGWLLFFLDVFTRWPLPFVG